MASQGRKRRADGAMPKQDVGTPPDFLEAVRKRWGVICLDLAANLANHVCGNWVGEGGSVASDALAEDWTSLGRLYAYPAAGCVWLNPPFRDAEPWLIQANRYLDLLPPLLVLLPASIGTQWFDRQVLAPRRCLIHALNPRLTFVGETKPYPKDLMLLEFGSAAREDVFMNRDQLRFWRWK